MINRRLKFNNKELRFNTKHLVLSTIDPFPIDGLISRYTFTFENYLYDAYGTNNLTAFTGAGGAYTYPAGKIGTGLYLDGIAGAYNDNLVSYIIGKKAWSISMWFYFVENEYSSNKILFLHSTEGIGDFDLTFSVDGRAAAEYIGLMYLVSAYADAPQVVQNTEQMLKDQWNHLVLTSSGLDMKLYLNNDLKYNAVWGGFGTPAGNLRLYFGNDPTGNNKLDEKFDQIYFYNKVLSTDEIAILYNSGNGI